MSFHHNLGLIFSAIDLDVNFQDPYAVIFLIASFALAAYAIYILLGKIRIFRSVRIANIVIAAIMALFALRFGIWTFWGGIAGILFFKLDSYPKRFIGLLLTFAIASQITSIFAPKAAIGMFFFLIGLFILFKVRQWKLIILLGGVLIAIYFVLIGNIEQIPLLNL